jgi:hypothetical protein
MKNIGNTIKTLQNIMRKDPGVSGTPSASNSSAG